jgi:transcriptional regulator with XRE-family HTH domain
MAGTKKKEDTLGFRLSLLRQKLGLSQKDLAIRMGVSSQTILNYEANRRCPDTDFLSQLMEMCHVNVNWLIGGQEPVFLFQYDVKKNKDLMELYRKLTEALHDIA